MKLKLLFFITFFFPCLAFAQSAGTVKGSVVGAVSNEPVPGVIVTLTGQDRQVTTDANGNFIFRNLQPGSHVIQLNSVLITPKSVTIEVEKLIDAGMVDDDVENASQDVSSTVILSNDVFLNRAAYQLSPARFSPRGYTGSQELKYINGVEFNDQNRGVFNYASVGALNDMTRNGDVTNFTAPSTFTFGALGGAENINMRASSYTPGGKATVSYTNRNYYLRGMFTYSTGLNEKGWAFTASAGGRYSHEGNIDGTFYNNLALAFSAEKQWQGGKHSLSMTAFVSPVQRGQQGNSYREVYELTDNYLYNPNWGYQNGKKRNAKVVTAFDPTAVISHIWKIDDTTTLTTGVGAHYARYGNTALNWYNAPDPRPDYYRNLPSYYMANNQFSNAAQIAELWRTSYDTRQINWDRLYDTNYRGEIDEGTYGAGHRSNYMIEERHTDQRDFNFAANIAHTFRNQSVLRGGLTARINRTEYYDQVKDLLGADYWLDVDKFALRDNGNYNPLLSQNDLDYYLKHGEARRVGEGDKFSYDYYANLRQAQVWAQYYASFGGFTMSRGGEVGYTAMWRDGRLRKGLFANNSLGKSKTLDYLTYKLKGEFSYRFSGAHAIDANVAYMVNPPQFRDAFVSARTRNTTTPGLDSEKVLGVDLSYNLNLPWITARVSGYYTSVADQSKVISYYDDTQSSFTNFAMSGIDKRYYGLEVGVVVPIWGGISFNGALSLGDYRYTSDANFTQTRDNSEEVLRGDKVLWDDLYVESTPQTALNLGLSYRGPRNWFASVDFNYYDRIYLSMNPARRTRAAYATVLRPDEAAQLPGAVKYTALMNLRDQEKFDSAYTLNLSVGKNWYIHRIYQLGFSLEVKNILNDQTIRTGGYEQMRLSRRTYVNKEGAAAQPIQYYVPFDSKYFYLLGTTYYLNVYFRF